MKDFNLPSIIHRYFLEYLPRHKGLQSSSIRSYRDSLRLFLIFVAGTHRLGVSELVLEHLDYPAVQAFLHSMEADRGNAISTRNQRLAALHVFYEYVGRTVPEMLPTSAKVAAIPMKRCPRPEMTFLGRDEVQAMFACIPAQHRLSSRDRALLMLLYNTGARVSEVAHLKVEQLDLRSPARVRLLGKGSKWRTCPLWNQTAKALQAMLDERGTNLPPESPVFVGASQAPMTRFGIYKRIRHYATLWEASGHTASAAKVTPHVFRHTTAVHLLESGVEVNVIRGWLGHVNLETTNRYAEITIRMKAEALKLCDPIVAGVPRKPAWKDDAAMMAWLSSL
ncbi:MULTISPECIES: tyrosine-type recombinase/integrase [Pseudomonadota]|uniref:Tyrosine-based site-specific recombinase, N-terminal SAM-like protein n=2 Tax=Burkholderiales TaxID=80840 RepID=Q1LNZ9_CUPMC|nr:MULTISPECIES: tyrosine-type recombinase/integrase [Pseudomonadota]ABF08127.1 tyrosine-based site-specific recombinase, N-terminal SAM-like protein [Cupriavidus metallidurans CH34]QGS27600.1 tyrosine-type recombinase/integrase [Cupriavidus metallidurans]CAB3941733.1 Tyrosine recombinase XerD [Achromobacter insolitus]HBO2915976.1 tyrosine-type recombinase/integrase [Pseudomonas aeruginosa]HCE9357459.1 tyrosine-type recombinase/integrase [Pseudomonas aeruginosa]